MQKGNEKKKKSFDARLCVSVHPYLIRCDESVKTCYMCFFEHAKLPFFVTAEKSRGFFSPDIYYLIKNAYHTAACMPQEAKREGKIIC